jgi:anthraniloyl-CoA monooxygenase
VKIACVGGGPTGLYFAILMKLRDPRHEVTVFERNRPNDTFGWGVVFSDQTLANLSATDPVTGKQIADDLNHWDDIEVHFRSTVQRSGGHGFCGIGRLRLLEILQARAAQLGVELRFQAEVEPDLDRFAEHDLVIASDGINSRFRERYREHFGVDVDVRRNKFVWLGTRKVFDAFTFIFERTEHGWLWVHAYRYDANTSTFIVECSEETFRAFGFENMSQEEIIATLERRFASYLDGERLMSNATHLRGAAIWINFRRILCERWHYRNLILMGDAAHTAHFSIGSGTKLGFEDAIHLARELHSGRPLAETLETYRDARQLEVLKLQNAARNSTEWFENVPRYARLEPQQFFYSLLTRSQRVSHENLRVRDRQWLESVESGFAERATGRRPAHPVRPMFVPFRLRDLELENRVVVSPMDMYSAVDGVAGDFHLVHLGSRAQGGAGLVYTEMVCVSPEGRITPGCTGMYREEHLAAWRRIVEFVHRHTRAKIALQLGHSGPKGSTRLMWEGMDEPLEADNWPVIGPSAVPWSRRNQVPRPMTRRDMDEIKAQFVRSTEMGASSGFDLLELHCAHGYLLSAFITPLTNRRTNEYGGPLENRLRFPLEVFAAMRHAWPGERPMSVRISATDWVPGGVDASDAVEIARAFARAGADIVDVSAGQTSIEARPIYGRMFQTPFSDRIRNEVGIATMAVGNIFEPDHVNGILASGRADLCCLARPHLADPYWTLHAAAQLRHGEQPWPVQYLSGRAQYERNLERAASAELVQV